MRYMVPANSTIFIDAGIIINVIRNAIPKFELFDVLSIIWNSPSNPLISIDL